MFAHDACELARAAVQNGVADADLLALARLGNEGLAQQNELHDLRRLHDRTFGKTVEPQYLKLTLKNEMKNGVEVCSVPVLSPYEVFHVLYEEGAFAKSITGDFNLRSYWSHLMSQPWASTHYLFDKPELWDTTIPLVFFTDGAEFAKSS